MSMKLKFCASYQLNCKCRRRKYTPKTQLHP